MSTEGRIDEARAAPRDDAGRPDHADRADGSHGNHGNHGNHGDHAGHDPEMFRRRFWVTLVLSIPIVVTSDTIMDWFGYSLELPGRELVGPVLGTVVFFWGGWPFLAGAAHELRGRRPGMMLLIALAITVAYGASLASTSLGWFDLEFWWELGRC
ncbi:MAG: hypothetical protein U5R31_10960 [Acidimicrobiia bacterium]|nr:hypothetical protein [Acidimicrobiia bacterium]